MKYCAFLLAILTLAGCATSKPSSYVNQIKEVRIYNYFEAGGYTTAGAYSQITKLEAEGVATIEMKNPDLDTLLYILSKAKVKKSSPGKTGIGLLFARFVYADKTHSKITFQTNAIRDYTLRKTYSIKNAEHQKWITEFKSRMKTQ